MIRKKFYFYFCDQFLQTIFLRPFIPGQRLGVLLEHRVRLRHDGRDDQGLVVQTLHDVRVRLRVVPGKVRTGGLVPDPNPGDQK